MIKLLKIELQKIIPNKTFWVLIILYTILTCIVLVSMQELINHITAQASEDAEVKIPSFSIYRFPDIWHNLTFLAGFFKVFLAVIIIILVTNEYSFKTIRQNIVSGISRMDFMTGKILVITLLSLFATCLIILTGLILGFINSPDISFSKVFREFTFNLAYFLEVFAYLLFALFIAVLVKKSGLAIGLLLLYAYVIEPLVVFKLPDNLERIMPLESISRLIDIPNTALMRLFGINFNDHVPYPDVLITLGYSCLFIYATYLLFEKRDL
jgi:ABC-2 type transport system permease protein